MTSPSTWECPPRRCSKPWSQARPTLPCRFGQEDADLKASDDRLLIEDVLAGFTPKEQQVVRLRFIDGLTQAEIAQRLDISQVQVSRLLRRTLKRMQEKIAPDGLPDGIEGEQ